VFLTRRDAHQPVAVGHVFVRQTEFLRAEEQRYWGHSKSLGDESASVFQTAQGMLQHTGSDGRSTHYQRAIGHGFGDGGIFAGFFEYGMRLHCGAGFQEGNVVRIHQTKFGESEIAHGAGGGSDIEGIARGD
jgi:hypothetical protein